MSGQKDYFSDKVRGNVRAALVLDDKGEPVYIESGGRRHYKIKLSLQTDNPDVRRVVYKLDPTYYDSIRESNDLKQNFGVETTTYGDYGFVVDVTVGSGVARQTFVLSDLLGETHQKDKKATVAEALSTIKDN